VLSFQNDDDSEEEDEDANYLQRLDGGLFTLQRIDYVLLEICAGAPPSVKARVLQILNLRGGSLKTIRHVMRGEKDSLQCSQRTHKTLLLLPGKYSRTVR